MSRFNHNLKITVMGYVYRALITVAAIVGLIILLPVNNSGILEYRVGKPWLGNDVIAQNDFPLLKPDSVIEQEETRIREEFKPVYELNPDVENKQINLFVSEFNSKKGKYIPSYYRKFVQTQMRAVYSAGIMPLNDMNRETTENHQTLTVSLKNMGEQRLISAVYTPFSAYDYILAQADTTQIKPAVLREMDIEKFLVPNLVYDKKRSETQLNEEIKNITYYSGEVQKGMTIVRHGDIVTEQTDLILSSMEKQNNANKITIAEMVTQRIGQVIFILIIVTCMFFYLRQFRPDFLSNWRTLLFIVLMVFSFPAITYAIIKWNVNPYVVPYCMLPIFLRVFTDSRTAFIIHVSSILLSAIAVTNPFEFIFTEVSAGLVAIFSMRQLSSRSELFRAVMYIMACSLLCTFCFDLINKSFFTADGVSETTYMVIVANAVLLMISYLLLFPFERLFRFTSNVTMVELSNTNNEVLRRLSEEAPGTFQHSLQVANIAGEVARKIGVDTQLVRTGALYHDIGKLGDPAYFTENQNGKNPHDGLSFAHSAQILINHVRNGLELAEKYKLPPVIREFISTHHGYGKTRYFLVKQQNAHPNDVVDERPFTYPGPNPHTAEQAILMMADSVEAASRSLSEYTEESISNLVDHIVDSQMKEGYFNLCPITFEDIDTAKQVFKEKLKVIYHTRISYPTLSKEAQATLDSEDQTGSTSK